MPPARGGGRATRRGPCSRRAGGAVPADTAGVPPALMAEPSATPAVAEEAAAAWPLVRSTASAGDVGMAFVLLAAGGHAGGPQPA